MSVAKVDVVDVPMAEIQPYWRNPRKNDKTIPALSKSIKRYGFNVPLVLDQKKVIVTGHARFRALKQLGWDTVPCVLVDMDQKRLREFRVMDNRVAELSAYDEEALKDELERVLAKEDVADFFAGSLDRVVDMDDLLGVDVGGIPDFDAIEKGIEDDEPVFDPTIPVDKRKARCPFCETELTEQDVVE